MRERADCVGPVLEAGPLASVLIAAIREQNGEVEVQDRGAYFRVLVPQRCVLSRAAIERRLGRAFRLPGDLELVMPSFKGAFSVDEDLAVWEVKHA
jgi:toluene monooxygenase system protein D